MKVIVIGGGHNGLIASIFLREAGFDVTLVEAREKLGGMVDTVTFNQVRLNRASYVLGLMPIKLINYFKIPIIKQDPFQVIYTEGKIYPFWRDFNRRIKELKNKGIEKIEIFENKILKFKELIEEKFLFTSDPPSKERILEESEKRGLEEFLILTAKKFLEEYLPEELQEFFIYRGMENSPAYVVAYYYSPNWSFIKGGMGTLIEILEDYARKLGVKILIKTKAEEIIVKNEKVTGIRANNRVIEGDIVVSCISPESTVHLIKDLDIKFSGLSKPRWMKYALILKEFPKVPENLRPYLGSIIDSDYGEVVIPFINDPTIGGITMEFMGNYELIKDLFKFDPVYEIKLTADDAEKIYYLPRGDLNHLPMRDPYLFDNRPMKGWVYRTPIKGLYLGSAGTYPGGQVTGVPGYNVAMTVIEDYKLRNNS
jgi:phytoene dehydrogenase-like protein